MLLGGGRRNRIHRLVWILLYVSLREHHCPQSHQKHSYSHTRLCTPRVKHLNLLPLLHSNTFIDNDLDIAFDNRGMNWMADYCNYNCTGYTPNAAQSAGCFKTEMEKIHYQQPPYATHYPELVNIYENHPCVPINNVIEDNVYCHARSMNMTGSRHGFIDATESQVESWLSTMSNNRQVCE